MDDNPKVNESWTDGAGDASTITAVGGTMTLANGSKIIDIATDQWTGSFSTITWGFAKGVGFTSIGVGTQTTSLSSFTVNAATSQSRSSQAVRTAHASPGKIDVAAAMSKLLR
jgi:hypothetical protein